MCWADAYIWSFLWYMTIFWNPWSSYAENCPTVSVTYSDKKVSNKCFYNLNGVKWLKLWIYDQIIKSDWRNWKVGSKYVCQAHLSKNLLVKACAVSPPWKEKKGGLACMGMIKHEFYISFWYSCDYVYQDYKETSTSSRAFVHWRR